MTCKQHEPTLAFKINGNFIVIKTSSEKEPYKIKFTNSTVISYSDNAPDKGGNGDGFRPHELLEAALACCVNMSVRMYADNNSMKLDSVSTTVTIDRSQPQEACFEYNVQFNGKLSASEKDDILEMIKNCPVRKTLSSKISFKMKD